MMSLVTGGKKKLAWKRKREKSGRSRKEGKREEIKALIIELTLLLNIYILLQYTFWVCLSEKKIRGVSSSSSSALLPWRLRMYSLQKETHSRRLSRYW